MSARYAIYFAPAPGSALGEFGASWLGRAADTPTSRPQPLIDGVPAERLRALTASPRHYGFHATMKAPFRLAEGVSERALIDALDRFAAARRPIQAPPLQVSDLRGFIALTLSAAYQDVDDLAADCVRAFEPFRAPLSEAEIGKRRQSPLTARQDAQLLGYGYPHIFADFIFHMTLTERLSAPEHTMLLKTLRSRAASCSALASWQLDGLAVFVQRDREAPFLLHHRATFTG